MKVELSGATPMIEEPSERLIEQRIRNRIYDLLEILADCDAGVDLVGIKGYFDLFEDFVHRPSIEAGTSALSKDERMIVLEIAEFLEAAGETNPDFTKAEFIESDWPGKIAPTARDALALFLRRGLFSEKVEEVEPGQSSAIPAAR